MRKAQVADGATVRLFAGVRAHVHKHIASLCESLFTELTANQLHIEMNGVHVLSQTVLQTKLLVASTARVPSNTCVTAPSVGKHEFSNLESSTALVTDVWASITVLRTNMVAQMNRKLILFTTKCADVFT